MGNFLLVHGENAKKSRHQRIERPAEAINPDIRMDILSRM
jgi:hypothetical protein